MGKPAKAPIGSLWKMGEGVWEVIYTRPGGHVTLFDRNRSRFLDTYVKDLDPNKRLASR